MANCPPCNSNSGSTPVYFTSIHQTFTDCECESCDCNGATMDTKCIFYTGPNLPCATINTNDSLEDILIKVDQKLCATLGNYAFYNKFCIDDSASIATEQQFVEAISEYVCTLRTDLETFTETTFVEYQGEVETRLSELEVPAIECASAGVLDTDELQIVLGKFCTAITDIKDNLDVSGAAWDSCNTVDPNPTTLEEAFDVLIGQICAIQGGETALPTFNNTGSCLPGTLTTSDTLEDTVTKIRTKLCLTPEFDINALTWGCTVKPSTTATDLQSAFDAVLDKITTISQNLPTFSADFDVTLTDGGDPCAGKTVALAASSAEDKWVAVDGADGSPGTLSQKIVAGTGISLDTTTTPGTMIINSTGGTGVDVKVKVRTADPTAGFLEDKIEGSSSSTGIEITATTNTVDNKVTIGSEVDFTVLWQRLIEILESDANAKAAFCEQVQSCLPDCVIPPNVTVIYQDTNQTTTSTTTTTTTTV